MTKFKRSHLPFRYLGIPIYSKRIPTAEGRVIIEKMVKRIKVWSTRKLSYMARLTLVNSVLLSIQSYWAQLTILPKRMIQEVEAICRDFLWKGIAGYEGPGLVAWSKLCVMKSQRVGIQNLLIWNKAAVGKYIWAIASKKDTVIPKNTL